MPPSHHKQAPQQATEVPGDPGQTLTRSQAIATAFLQQPPPRVYHELDENARSGEGIALATFLTIAVARYIDGGC